MGKIGRNEPCPCGSGKKFKKCCLGKSRNNGASPPMQTNRQTSLKEEIVLIQEDAVAKKRSLKSIGVFILLSTESGDGWLLEITEMDALLVAADGKKLNVEIDESPETIEINWTHKFAVKNKQFQTTAYADKTVKTYEDYPAHRIQSIIKKSRQKFSPELLNSLHVSEKGSDAAQSING